MDRIFSASVFHRWGLIGDSLGVPAEWASVRSLINAVESYSRAHREELRRLLHQSDTKLDPLCDPLTANLGLNRWLAAEREEAYSDWLAWVLQQLTPAQLLSLFDNQLNLQSLDPLAAPPSISREVRILDGRRRLDIQVAFGDNTLLVIEIKTIPEQNSDTEKNKEYKQWIDSQKFTNKKQVLIAPEVSDHYRAAPDGGFLPVLWRELCVRLRVLLLDPDFRRDRLVTAALIIAFVGAVEQNLLKFVTPDADEGRSLLYAASASHVREALASGNF